LAWSLFTCRDMNLCPCASSARERISFIIYCQSWLLGCYLLSVSLELCATWCNSIKIYNDGTLPFSNHFSKTFSHHTLNSMYPNAVKHKDKYSILFIALYMQMTQVYDLWKSAIEKKRLWRLISNSSCMQIKPVKKVLCWN
jgi:hypothetical protein